MINYNRIKIILGVTSLFCMLFFLSCSEENKFASSDDVLSSSELTFAMIASDTWKNVSSTRAVTPQTKILSENNVEIETLIDGHRFILCMTELSGIDSSETLDTASLTRGTIPADDELDLGVYAYVTPKSSETDAPKYDAAKSQEYMINQKVDVSEGFTYFPVMYWPGDEYWINFFAYRPYIDNINTETNTYLTIDASDNVPKMQYIVPENVDDQVDLLATATETFTGDHRQTVILPFAHMLSAIQFKVGSIPALEIIQIGVKQVASVGTSIDMNREASWSSVTTDKDFTQDFVGFSAEENSGKQIGKTFYLLPQSFDENTELSITVRFGASGSPRDYNLTVPLKKFCEKWQKGHTYIYTLTTPQEVDMELEETFTMYGNVKSDVCFENTGLAPLNVRAAIIGYWIVKREINGQERECVIAAWKPDTDGTFAGLPGNGWEQKSDGFYYYAPVLKKGEKTTDLFDSYTLNANPPAVGAELVLTIAGQARLNGYDGLSWNSISSSN